MEIFIVVNKFIRVYQNDLTVFYSLDKTRRNIIAKNKKINDKIVYSVIDRKYLANLGITSVIISI